jgi:alkylhydroperoxidase family enzyme
LARLARVELNRRKSMSSTALTSEHGSLPIQPLEGGGNWFARLLLAAMRRRYGVTPTLFRVLYTRAPFIGLIALFIYLGMARFLRIDRDLAMLLQQSIATQNGCTFCADIQLAEAVRRKMGRERFRDLFSFESSENFSAREKAALAYARAVNESLHVPDAVWSQLEKHFSERERIDIVWVCAVERYFNSIALPLRVGSDRLAERSRAAR